MLSFIILAIKKVQSLVFDYACCVFQTVSKPKKQEGINQMEMVSFSASKTKQYFKSTNIVYFPLAQSRLGNSDWVC